MTNLMAAAALFLGIHLAISGTGLRRMIIGKIGESRYIPAFALASLAAIIWLCIAYSTFSTSAANIVLFVPPQPAKALGVVAMAAAFCLVVPGVLRRNPTTAGQEQTRVDGILRVTRHPFLTGVSLWAAFHVTATGRLAGSIFFGTFLILAVFGTHAIDRKAAQRRPEAWRDIAAQTSVIPFAAIAEGRNRFIAPEILDWRITIAAMLFGLLFYFHGTLFGVAPFPAGLLAL
jgi:uncharacterized membrane protein